ncbi:MAG: amino acid adenylation domain-containing protein, partial [bacterium]|nr:amino acid adenylation domain-containing protein [bacterium]
FEYCTKLFKEETIKRYITYLKGILQAVCDAPNQKIAEIEIITKEEKNKILYEFNDTSADYPQDKTIHEIFGEQVAKKPGSVATVGSGLPPTTSLIQLTYSELNKKSNRLAQQLQSKGVRPGTIVAIMPERSIAMIIGLLGILKAGGVYLPIDPVYPRGRINYILADSNTKILLSGAEEFDVSKAGEQGLSEDEWEKKGIEKIDLTEFSKNSGRGTEGKGHGNGPYLRHSTGQQESYIRGQAASPAYIIYTSGSTGRPKGVIIRHSSLVNFVNDMKHRFGNNFSKTDKCLSLTSISFDVSIAEIFMPLSFGSTLLLMPNEKIIDVDNLSRILVEKCITFTYIPPALLKAVFEKLATHTAGVKLNKLLVGVESIPDTVLEDYQRLNPAMIIINAYGPTEATICATAGVYYSHEPTGQNVPIGGPMDNTQVYIMGKSHRLKPPGVPGELFIAGRGLALGYLNNPELTVERFTKSGALPNNHLYRTGDLARWQPDGNIEFLGRIDHQVKIRGFRIECGEIENNLLKHPEIEEAVVLARESNIGDPFLCAYYVAGSTQHPESGPPGRDEPRVRSSTQQPESRPPGIRPFLSQYLPDYMIPAFFIKLEK